MTEIKNVLPEPKKGSTDKNPAASTDLTKRHDDVTPYQKNLTVPIIERLRWVEIGRSFAGVGD